jgi:NTE family protein
MDIAARRSHDGAAGSTLVLSGGGPLAVGWELGVLRGLRDHGVDMAHVDRVIGTSAGAIVGALLTSGAALAPLRVNPEPGSRESARPAPMNPDVWRELLTILTEGGTADQARRAKLGALALETTIPEGVYLDTRRHVVPDVPWPKPLIVTGVDAGDGSFATWGVSDGVPLLYAVAASTALPGVWPPVTIGGRRFMDGGVRSAMSADLALDSRVTVLVAALPGREHPTQLRAEIAAIEGRGGRIVEVRPDAEAEAAFGADRMDETRQPLVFEAGRRQGGAVASDVLAHLDS